MLHCRYTTKKNAPLISDAFQPAKGGLRTLWFSPPIPSVDWVTGAGFFLGRKREMSRLHARSRGEKGRRRLPRRPYFQLSPSRVPLARSIREINKKQPAPATKVCPVFFPKAANGPRWDQQIHTKTPPYGLKFVLNDQL